MTTKTNPYASDAPGGGVGGKDHGLSRISGSIRCSDPVTGQTEQMRFELPAKVDPRIIKDSNLWAKWIEKTQRAA